MKRIVSVMGGAGVAAFVFALGCDRLQASPTPAETPVATAPRVDVVEGAGGDAPSGHVVPAAAVKPSERLVTPLPSLAPLVKELRPAVVNIYTSQKSRARRLPGRNPQFNDPGFEEFMERFFGGGGGGMPGQQDRQALGSGFLIGNAMALTNNHVVESADEIRVKLSDGREFAAKVSGRDANTDIALLKLEGEGVDDLSYVELGDSEAIEVGDYVVAIGNPFGLQHTVTAGIVSAKARNIGAGPYDDFIQTDASINPGNSGGPLFNLKGEVVGINTAIVARGQGIGFAVPSNLVKELLPQLRDKGHVTRGWLGVGIQEVTPELARTFGLGQKKGALISQVFPDGPAAAAGVKSGDVVVEVNGKSIEAPGDLSRAIASIQPGGEAKLKILRDGKEVRLGVKVAQRDDEKLAGGVPSGSGSDSGAKAEESVGVRVSNLPAEVARRLGIAENEGLLVTAVLPDSAAAAANVQPNDVLLEVNRQPTNTVEAFRKAAKETKPGDTVLFRVRRGGGALYLAARVPKP